MLDLNNALYGFVKVKHNYYHTKIDSPGDVYVFDFSNNIDSSDNVVLLDGEKRIVTGYGVTSDYKKDKHWFWVSLK